MTIGELIPLFSSDAPLQINIITAPGALTFIPNPSFFQRNPKLFKDVDQMPITHLSIEAEEHEGRVILLLIINDNPILE